MFILVIDSGGNVVARCRIVREQLAEWLVRNGPEADRCEVYTDPPERGGMRVAVLRRSPGQAWLSA